VELRLVVEADGLPERELAVDVQPGHEVRELVAALVAQLELKPGREELALYCRRTRTWLSAGEEIQASGLRTGDRVALVDPHRPLRGGPRAAADPRLQPGRPGVSAHGPLVDLLVVGGPSAGRRVPMVRGEHRVGSHRYSEIMLDDAAMSGVHVLVTVDAFGHVAIADASSETGIFINGRRISGSVPVPAGQVVAAGRTLLAFRPHAARGPAGARPDASGRVAFNRPPRVARQPAPTEFKLEAPPAKERGARLPLSSAIVPLVMGLGMGVGMYYLGGRQVQYLLFSAFMVLSPVMAIFSLFEGRGRGSHRKRVAAWRERLKGIDREMAAAASAEAALLVAGSPDTAALAERADALDPSLWERRPEDADWLLLRAGWYDRPSSVRLELADGGEEDLREEAARVARRHLVLPAAPMLVSLRDAGVVGLAGDPRQAAGLARSLGVQLATLHSPQDLAMAAAVPGEERADWAWLSWLPHVRSESALAGPLLVADRPAARALLDRLLTLVAERQAMAAAYHGATPERLGPAVVTFVHEAVELPRGAVSTLLQQGPPVGVYAVWLARTDRALPGECGAVVQLASGPPVLTLPATGESSSGGGPEGVSLDIALEVGRALAPVHDVSSRERTAEIPRRVNLMALLGLQDDPDSGVLQSWIRDRSTPDERLLEAAWGAADAGEVYRVSLRRDGPHALVGGMTGSGKSELLQSLVASLAVSHSPRSLNFLLVDYKGGAAFKDCVDLPHTVGFVTDLDGHLVNRALISLRAELRRREEILREFGAKDLLDLEHKQPDHTPASLLIVVDEFAALAAELPEFVEGMVDVAQRGRSMGVHLLLATQRPQGVINDKIRANMNLRVSLRFSDEGESMDIIGTKDAARPGLPPGRAFARTGPGEVTEFQAGYVGGHTAASGGPPPVSVRGVGFGGVATAGHDRGAPRATEEEVETDLLRLVRVMNDVNRRLGLPAPPRPWLPTLPDQLPLADLPPPPPLHARIGLVDEPAGQRQVPVDFGLEEGGLLVHGTGGSGKTTLLRTLAVSLALSTPPDRLHVYGLDFATRGLRSLEALPHCGGIVAGDELERAVRLLSMLRAEVERRKGLLAATGAAKLSEYLAAGPAERLPYVLVLLDGCGAFLSTFESIDVGAHVDTLRMLVAEGRSVGVTFVISADRQAGYLAASIGRRLIMRMATDDDYGLLGLPRTAYAGAHLPPGRGFTDKGLELHCAIVGSDPLGSAQAAEASRLGEELRERYGQVSVPRIRLLPAEVRRSSLPPPRMPLEAVVGIEDLSLQPVRVGLEDGHFLIAGPRRSGRTTALATFATSLGAAPGAPPLHLLSPRRQTPLAALDVWASVALGADACGEATVRLAEAAREAPDRAGTGVIVIDDGEDLADGSLMDLDWIAQRGRELGMRLLVAVETQAAHRAFATWLQQVQRERQGILLDPDPTLDGTLIGVQLPRRSGGRWPAGRCYLARRGIIELVQVAGD
jgi:S-DNA-T family DNA segregation ATPase FtsK/SpoIIIE